MAVYREYLSGHFRRKQRETTSDNLSPRNHYRENKQKNSPEQSLDGQGIYKKDLHCSDR